MQAIKKPFLLSAIIILLSPAICFAAETNPADKSADYNMLLISLVGLMLVLLFVIGMLANTLRQLSFVVRDKIIKEKNDAAKTAKAISS